MSNVFVTRVCGDAVSYVVNRNINYTNVCTYKCAFCAFSKVRASTEGWAVRGKASTFLNPHNWKNGEHS